MHKILNSQINMNRINYRNISSLKYESNDSLLNSVNVYKQICICTSAAIVCSQFISDNVPLLSENILAIL